MRPATAQNDGGIEEKPDHELHRPHGKTSAQRACTVKMSENNKIKMTKMTTINGNM